MKPQHFDVLGILAFAYVTGFALYSFATGGSALIWSVAVLGVIGAGGLIVDCFIVHRFFVKKGASAEDDGALGRINERRADAKERRKDKIMNLFSDKREITNDDVERLLGVSDSTATNYLDELERGGQIVQVGTTGRSVFYRRRK